MSLSRLSQPSWMPYKKSVCTVMLGKLHPLKADFPGSPVGWKSLAAADFALAELLPFTSAELRCLWLPHFSSLSQTYVKWIAGSRSCAAGISSHTLLFGADRGESRGAILRWGNKRKKSRLPRPVIPHTSGKWGSVQVSAEKSLAPCQMCSFFMVVQLHIQAVTVQTKQLTSNKN